MATFWAFIQLLVKFGPGLWQAAEEGWDQITLNIKEGRFEKAAQKAEETGDQRELENQFSPGRHPSP